MAFCTAHPDIDLDEEDMMEYKQRIKKTPAEWKPVNRKQSPRY